MPHILSEAGNKKLSKRDGAKDVLDYIRDGFLPEALVNFIASLGWNDGTEQEVFSVAELIEKFSLERVGRSGAHFDEKRLEWLNGAHIRQLSLDNLYNKVADFWPAEAADSSDDYKKQVLGLVQERLKYFKELPELTTFFFVDLPINPELIDGNKQLKKLARGELARLLEAAKSSLEQSDFSAEDLTNRLNDLLEQTGQKPGILFSLIRIATTQAPASPGLADTLAVLGKEIAMRRLDQQLASL
jgi:glutamyl-tRNA synthetase